MPQQDKYRPRQVPIEFVFREEMKALPYEDRMTLIFISLGKVNFIFNEKSYSVEAPYILCLSPYDTFELIDGDFSAKSFSFYPGFVNGALTFETLAENNFSILDEEHDRNMMNLFLYHTDTHTGIFEIPANMYFRFSEWLNIIGTETYAQSDGNWTCRIRRYLLQILYLLDDLRNELTQGSGEAFTKSIVDVALEYIHTNYQTTITLDDLCRILRTNRTTLNNQFKARVGFTALQYLSDYRIRIAKETLTHTNLTLAEIADACGYKYDTYFIKQFTKSVGISPTEYRQRNWFK